MKLLGVIIVLTFFIYFASGYNCKSVVNNSTVRIRHRRYLDFMKATRIWFRANIKENIFTWGSIWAQAIGFKANMNILNDNKLARPYRRDTYEVLQQLLDFHGFDGEACLLKVFCISIREPDGQILNGILLKLMRHIFKLDEQDRKHFSFLNDENCDKIPYGHCPLSFNSISPFTDDI